MNLPNRFFIICSVDEKENIKKFIKKVYGLTSVTFPNSNSIYKTLYIQEHNLELTHNNIAIGNRLSFYINASNLSNIKEHCDVLNLPIIDITNRFKKTIKLYKQLINE